MQQEAQAGEEMLGGGLAGQQGDLQQHFGYSAVGLSARHAAGTP